MLWERIKNVFMINCHAPTVTVPLHLQWRQLQFRSNVKSNDNNRLSWCLWEKTSYQTLICGLKKRSWHEKESEHLNQRLHSMLCVSAWICVISTCYFTHVCLPECCDRRCSCCGTAEEVCRYGFKQITSLQSYRGIRFLCWEQTHAAREISFLMHLTSKSRYLSCGCDAPEQSDVISEARERQEGESKCCQFLQHRLYFQRRIKENLYSSAKCFAFASLHHDIADKRTHFARFNPDQTSKISSDSFLRGILLPLWAQKNRLCALHQCDFVSDSPLEWKLLFIVWLHWKDDLISEWVPWSVG